MIAKGESEVATRTTTSTSTSGRVEFDSQDEIERRQVENTWADPKTLLGWITTTNHKRIGIRFIVTAFVFFAIAGTLALFMRLQLAVPRNTILGPDLYNQFFTTHGTAMMFLFAVPVMQGMGIYLV